MGGSLTNKHILLLPLSKQRFDTPDGVFLRSKIQGWVQQSKGVLQSELSAKTTHVVCSDDTPSTDEHLKQALASQDKLHIVKFKWLHDTLIGGTKQREKDHLFSTQPKSQLLQQSRTTDETGETSESVNNFTDVFLEGTKRHVDPRKKAQLERDFHQQDLEQDERLEQQRATELREKQREAKEAKEYVKKLRRDLLKPKNEVMAEGHHIYRCTEGFAHEVALIKVDVANNRNERITLTIYESNAEPHTYAVNMHAVSSAATAGNMELGCKGTNFQTALRQFATAFREKTEIWWDHRFDAFQPGSSHIQRIQDMDFAERPFMYHIPAYGPTGRSDIWNSNNSNSEQVSASTSEPVATALDLGHNMLGEQLPSHGHEGLEETEQLEL